jgi:hypothetical protein
VPTHGDYPWERDERASRRAHDPRGNNSPPPPATPAPWQPAQPWSAGLGLRRRVTGVEVAAVLAVVAVVAWLNWDHISRPYVSQPVGVGAPPPSLVANRPQLHIPTPLSALHSRLVTRSRVEVWGRVDAADGTTVRLTV